MCEVYILHDLVNQVRLRKLDLPVGEGLNVDADVGIDGPFILNVKLGSYFCDHLVGCCIAWGVKDAVIHVDCEYFFASIEDAVIHPGFRNLIYSSKLVSCWVQTLYP